MKIKQIIKAVTEAWKLANNHNEGSVIIQIKPHNRSLLVSHQIGNSWESMGLDAQESQKRILENFPCGEKYDFYDGDWFFENVDRISNEIENNFVGVS